MISCTMHHSVPRMLIVVARTTPFLTSTLTKAVAIRTLPKGGYSNSLGYVAPFFHEESSGSYKSGIFPVLIGAIAALSTCVSYAEDLRAEKQRINNQIDVLSSKINTKIAERARALSQFKQLPSYPINNSEIAFIGEFEETADRIQHCRSMSTADLDKHEARCFRDIDFMKANRSRYDTLMLRYNNHQSTHQLRQTLHLRWKALGTEISNLQNQLTPLLKKSNELEVAINKGVGFFRNAGTEAAYGMMLADLSAILALTLPGAAAGIGGFLVVASLVKAALEADTIGESNPTLAKFVDLLQEPLLRRVVDKRIRDKLVSEGIVGRLDATIKALKAINE